jgi:hypothetical protein
MISIAVCIDAVLAPSLLPQSLTLHCLCLYPTIPLHPHHRPLFLTPAMLLPLSTTTLLTLLLSSLVSSTDMRKCHNDGCLRSFEQHRHQAQRYCADHPDKFSMAPAPSWAGQCDSLGRMNNKRQRLASACSCLSLKPAATGEIASVAEPVSGIDFATTSTIDISASLIEATSSGVVDGESPTSTVDAAVATTTSSEDGTMEGK